MNSPKIIIECSDGDIVICDSPAIWDKAWNCDHGIGPWSYDQSPKMLYIDSGTYFGFVCQCGAVVLRRSTTAC